MTCKRPASEPQVSCWRAFGACPGGWVKAPVPAAWQRSAWQRGFQGARGAGSQVCETSPPCDLVHTRRRPQRERESSPGPWRQAGLPEIGRQRDLRSQNTLPSRTALTVDLAPRGPLMGLGRRLPALVRDRAASRGPVLRAKEPKGGPRHPDRSGAAAEAGARPDLGPTQSSARLLPFLPPSALHLMGYFYSYSG